MQIGLILVALAFPLLELAVLIKVGQTIGFWWTVLLLAATGVGGGLLVHQQGTAAARRAFEQMADGEAPLAPVLDSFFIMLAGLLLMIPGLITDIAGLLLLIPLVRRAVARSALRRAAAAGNIHVDTREWRSPGRSDGAAPTDEPPHAPRPPPRNPVVIDGEWQRIEDPPGSGTRTGSNRNAGSKPQPDSTKSSDRDR